MGSFFKKYTMILALVVVAIFFSITTQGKILFSQNVNNLISQNGYVFVLGAGMLLCILTGGNIDLSVGSVVCFTDALGAVLMQGGASLWVAVALMLLRVPVMPVAIGIYLPIGLNVSIFAGGMVRAYVNRLRGVEATGEDPGTLFSAGLIAGEGLCGILLAVLSLVIGAR